MCLGSRVLPPPKARLTPPQGLTLGNSWKVITDYTMWSMLQSTSKWHIATIATPKSGFGKSMAPRFFRRILRYFNCLSLWGWQKTSFPWGWRQAQHILSLSRRQKEKSRRGGSTKGGSLSVLHSVLDMEVLCWEKSWNYSWGNFQLYSHVCLPEGMVNISDISESMGIQYDTMGF